MQVNNGMAIYQALSELARRYQFRNRDEVCCYGLTVSQCYALQALRRHGRMPSSDLAVRLGLDISSTTRLVDELVKKKLAIRSKSAEDARVREIEITEAGSRLIRRLEADFASMLEQALEDFPQQVQKSLPAVLNRLTRVLNQCSTNQVIISKETLAGTIK